MTATRSTSGAGPAIPESGLGPTSPTSSLQPGRPGAGAPLAERGQRRLSWVALGLLLVIGATLAFVLVALAGDERSSILVAARDIEAGSLVELGDLEVAQVAAGDVNFIAPAERDSIIGQRARAAIGSGTPLLPELLVETDRLPGGQAVVGAVLSAGEYPASALSLGDQVVLMQVSVQGASGEGATEIGSAEIWAIEPVADQSEPRFFLSFVIASDLQLDVANAASQGRLRVALVDGQ